MNKKIRVLHVVEAAGGVERYLQTLFKFNDNAKVENILLSSQNYNPKVFKRIIKKHIVISMAHSFSPKSDSKSIRKIRKYIKKFRPDIVYAHSTKAGALARIANIGLKPKLIYNPHGWAFNMQQSKKKTLLYKSVEKLLAPMSDKIVCISEAEMYSALDNNICSKNKLCLIYNGIDIKEVEATVPVKRAEVGIPENAFVVGQVGRLSKQKAPDVFVKAAKLIKETIPNAYFLLVGDGELRPQIENMIKEYNLQDSFLITGWVDNPVSYMKIMNVGTLLSRWEGFGLVLPEYMASGVPIVATDVDAIPNIIKDGYNGLLISVDKPLSVSDGVKNLRENNDLQASLITNGNLCVETKFNGKRVTKDSQDLFNSLS